VVEGHVGAQIRAEPVADAQARHGAVPDPLANEAAGKGQCGEIGLGPLVVDIAHVAAQIPGLDAALVLEDRGRREDRFRRIGGHRGRGAKAGQNRHRDETHGSLLRSTSPTAERFGGPVET
jgi:hypothetical protein